MVVQVRRGKTVRQPDLDWGGWRISPVQNTYLLDQCVKDLVFGCLSGDSAVDLSSLLAGGRLRYAGA